MRRAPITRNNLYVVCVGKKAYSGDTMFEAMLRAGLKVGDEFRFARYERAHEFQATVTGDGPRCYRREGPPIAVK